MQGYSANTNAHRPRPWAVEPVAAHPGPQPPNQYGPGQYGPPPTQYREQYGGSQHGGYDGPPGQPASLHRESYGSQSSNQGFGGYESAVARPEPSAILKKPDAPKAPAEPTKALKRSTDNILYSPEVLVSIFNKLQQGIVVMTAHGSILAFSRGAQLMFGYELGEVRGENVQILMESLIAQRHDYYLSQVRYRLVRELCKALGFHKEKEISRITVEDFSRLTARERTVISDVVSHIKLFGGQKRELMAMGASGQRFPVEITVSGVLMGNEICFIGYLSDIRDITTFQNLSAKQELLLKTLMDSHTTHRLIRGETLIKDSFPAATVLFCDIQDFVAKCRNLDEEQIAQFVREIFGIYDKCLLKHSKCEKIKTFGDTYVVVSGVPMPNAHHTMHILHLACGMKKAIQKYTQRVEHQQSFEDLIFTRKARMSCSSRSSAGGSEGPGDDERLVAHHKAPWRLGIIPAQAKIGIHSGSVVAGVFSHIKAAYDLYGQTVNVSCRLMENCPPDKILISGPARKKLPEHLAAACEPSGSLSIKGLGTMETFVVSELENSSDEEVNEVRFQEA
eukprot:NODE_776_length_1877_cov_16.034857_g723_i0.p1 GENE.NODE_776_length_1877_cov_16.034857_g723_i0~~NODE_776_length_1877_cov_16.034857_g723_i0.p1  ORF type:complete len:564 (+),score=142.79 NODE_776_length_1877_cov_16.034857_g723_i0:1-1692(+)